MKVIQSVSNEYIKYLNKLKEKKHIQYNNQYLIEGKNIILEAMQNNVINTILMIDKEDFSDFPGNKIIVTPEILKKLSSNNSNSGAIAVCDIVEMEFNLDSFKKIIILEEVNNPGNFGNIIRTAKAFDFDAVVTLGNSVHKYNSKVISGSQGAIFNYPVIQKADKKIELKQNVYFFTLDNKSMRLEEIEEKEKSIALVFGNESKGLSEELLTILDGRNVYIDIKNIESLSLPIAAAIAMYKFK